MKITTTIAQQKMVSKAYKRIKYMGSFVFVMIAASYIGNHLSNDITDYIAFAEADEDLIISKNPRVGLDEDGKIATAQIL